VRVTTIRAYELKLLLVMQLILCVNWNKIKTTHFTISYGLKSWLVNGFRYISLTRLYRCDNVCMCCTIADSAIFFSFYLLSQSGLTYICPPYFKNSVGIMTRTTILRRGWWLLLQSDGCGGFLKECNGFLKIIIIDFKLEHNIDKIRLTRFSYLSYDLWLLLGRTYVKNQ
jgi:hypothetical protein